MRSFILILSLSGIASLVCLYHSCWHLVYMYKQHAQFVLTCLRRSLVSAALYVAPITGFGAGSVNPGFDNVSTVISLYSMDTWVYLFKYFHFPTYLISLGFFAIPAAFVANLTFPKIYALRDLSRIKRWILL